MSGEAGRNAFWEYLHGALALQQKGGCLAASGQSDEAVRCERLALWLLVEATRTLEPNEPGLDTVRRLAAAGLARLHSLNRRRINCQRSRPEGALPSFRAQGPSAPKGLASRKKHEP